MIHTSPTPPGLRAFREQLHTEAMEFVAKINAQKRTFVTHLDRHGYGTVVHSSAPNDLTVDPPDAGMVKVRWFDCVDANQLYWEYAAELRPAEVHPTYAEGR